MLTLPKVINTDFCWLCAPDIENIIITNVYNKCNKCSFAAITDLNGNAEIFSHINYDAICSTIRNNDIKLACYLGRDHFLNVKNIWLKSIKLPSSKLINCDGQIIFNYNYIENGRTWHYIYKENSIKSTLNIVINDFRYLVNELKAISLFL